jgi:aspartate aminotransferase
MLNNPSNPTGAVYTKDQLKAVAEICEKEGIYILSDEIYDQFVYEGHQFVSTASLSDAIKDITITVNGLSKTYAMPGWRVGYAAANQEIVKAMSTIQGHCVSHTSSISQYASIKELKTDPRLCQDMLEEYKRRRIFMRVALIPCREFPIPIRWVRFTSLWMSAIFTENPMKGH